MLELLKDTLNLNFTLSDILYTSIHLSNGEEIMPLEVNFKGIFNEIIEIKTTSIIKKGEMVVVNLFNNSDVQSIIGKSVKCVKKPSYLVYNIQIERIPSTMLNELIGLELSR